MSTNDDLDDLIIAQINSLDDTHRKQLIAKINEVCVDKPKLDIKDIELPKLTSRDYVTINDILIQIFSIKALPLPIQRNYVKQIRECYMEKNINNTRNNQRNALIDNLERSKIEVQKHILDCRTAKRNITKCLNDDIVIDIEKMLKQLAIIDQNFFSICDILENDTNVMTSSNICSELSEKLNDMVHALIMNISMCNNFRYCQNPMGNDPSWYFGIPRE